MKQIKILATVFDAGEPKYLAGVAYPATDDTKRQLALGNGEEVDAPAEAEEAPQPAATPEAQEPAAEAGHAATGGGRKRTQAAAS